MDALIAAAMAFSPLSGIFNPTLAHKRRYARRNGRSGVGREVLKDLVLDAAILAVGLDNLEDLGLHCIRIKGLGSVVARVGIS
jgi:hypothetical protein